MANRKHSIIDGLAPELKNAVEDMIADTRYRYIDIIEFLKEEEGITISEASISRYARRLKVTLDRIKIAQENSIAIAELMKKYPNYDFTEATSVLASQTVFELLNEIKLDDLNNMDTDKKINTVTKMMRAVAYQNNQKRRMDHIEKAGYEKVKKEAYATLAKEDPEAYKKLANIIDRKMEEL